MNTRDGRCVSLWQGSCNIYQARPAVQENNFYDVIIVGGGITGVSTALQLQEAGKRCLLLEANHLGFGTTGGTTAHINTLLDTPYTIIEKNFGHNNMMRVAQAVKDGLLHIKRNIDHYAVDCGFSEAAAYLFAQDEDQDKKLQQIAAATADAGVHVYRAEKIPVPVPFTSAIRAEGQAKFHPLEYVFALARAFEHIGGTIIQRCRVTGVENNDRVEVETSGGHFMAKDLVYATHIPPGVNLLHLRCIPYRSYAMAVLLENDGYPSDLAYDMADPYNYYRTQEVDGQPYFIAGGKDHKTGESANTEACFAQLESHLRQYFPVREVAYKWSSQYFEPADGLPYIGHLPGQPEHIYVACGYGGNGMIYSSVAATLITKQILEEASSYAALFDPNRIKPVAGFKNFITHNADVVRQFAGKLLSGPKLEQLADLAPDEGRLVAYEGKKLAVYKDEAGQLHAVSPHCTHLQCDVKWNSAEQSWDCPCHGSRFDADGYVLTGPADRDLERVGLGVMTAKSLQH
ncbi:(2Fe-2S)-binding protein [Chitinophaga alhagiae]|uniref:(2Fe-2S)-binding protein n=1 Tax=Chitinophaga alhagiae TaxID=2203219 RepID=A0ABM6WB07_9BACT|nr:FAD-dependent oxidoreductase [Chitinophaga alhagiae]AWO01124.1 (2Fe-2S)-binding protein [Chitinophaga alhagiae]